MMCYSGNETEQKVSRWKSEPKTVIGRRKRKKSHSYQKKDAYEMMIE